MVGETRVRGLYSRYAANAGSDQLLSWEYVNDNLQIVERSVFSHSRQERIQVRQVLGDDLHFSLPFGLPGGSRAGLYRVRAG